MAISTKNNPGLTGAGNADHKSQTIEMLKACKVHSVGHTVGVGEIITASADDARFLLAYKFAKKVTKTVSLPEPEPVVEEVEEVTEPVEQTAEETEVTVPETDEESTEKPARYFRGRRRRSE